VKIALIIVAGVLAIAGGIIGIFALLRWLRDHKREQELVFLQITTPKKESKEDKEQESEQFSTGKDFKEVLGVMDHLFQVLASVYNSTISRYWRGSPFFSVEYAALAGEILTFVVAPRSIASLIEKQITSFYPDAVVDEVEDYNIFTPDSLPMSTYEAAHSPAINCAGDHGIR
jgi:hypothetical protein